MDPLLSQHLSMILSLLLNTKSYFLPMTLNYTIDCSITLTFPNVSQHFFLLINLIIIFFTLFAVVLFGQPRHLGHSKRKHPIQKNIATMEKSCPLDSDRTWCRSCDRWLFRQIHPQIQTFHVNSWRDWLRFRRLRIGSLSEWYSDFVQCFTAQTNSTKLQ